MELEMDVPTKTKKALADLQLKTAFAGVRTAKTVCTVPPELSLNLFGRQNAAPCCKAVLFGRVVSHAPPTESYTNRFLSVHGECRNISLILHYITSFLLLSSLRGIFLLESSEFFSENLLPVSSS